MARYRTLAGRGGRGYAGGMKEFRRFHPRIPVEVRERFEHAAPEELWWAAEPLAGGRGTVRLLTVGGYRLIVKRERRGGVAALLLPNLYLLEGPFRREWEMACRLAEAELAPQPYAQVFRPAGFLFAVFTLSQAVPEALSLLGLWTQGRLGPERLRAAGTAVGRLHRTGLLHGDLNAGNLLLDEEGRALFLDFRHSRLGPGPPPAGSRHRNLLRLSRSLHKLRYLHSLPWPEGCWETLAEGYAAGWGEREPWLEEWIARSRRGFGLSHLRWGLLRRS